MIIPLGPGSLRDSSSLPEGQSVGLFLAQRIRAGPALPSYLALLHAGFSVPRMSPPGRWALTPPFHPCQMRLTERGRPLVLPRACRRGTSITGGLIFCGTFRSRHLAFRLRETRGAAPWRYQARCPAVADSCELATTGVRTFLPRASLSRSKPAIIRLTRQRQYTLRPGRLQSSAYPCEEGGLEYPEGGLISKPPVFRTVIRRGLARPAILPFHISSRGRRPRPQSWSFY